ncbi:glycosyltransferase family 2 protein [Paracoccus saliphilus]|uniref:Glycosyltransferase family 2 protein n=1 Tax=Paracoccus saliphilus TaxID=405559 RepID=A0AA46A6G1_9RHOB|nr:glycosyltransferase family 2 protein [Paracoccus saliphilus]WCR05483.1 glycosyltransferase family 2 protein [Paracoccus saliphilus]SIS97283.1 Glycosyltransferase, GT2 family [Paracoccus saliphilus]
MTVLTNTTAVIVTYNRSAKLMKVLDALERQSLSLDTILIVDNASTDDTQDRVEAYAKDMPVIRYLRLPENVGGAGGFHEGIKAAYMQGAHYIWVSDDDAYPEPDALQKLQEAIIEFEDSYQWRPSFACSRVEWTDGSLCEMNTPHPVWDWARFVRPGKAWALVDSCSFVSVLIPRWAVKEHGLPIADYFIWFDDAEYTRRLSRSYPGIFCPESRVTHDTPDNRGVNFGLVNDKSLWKFKYGARNETSFRRREQGFPGVVAYIYSVHQQMKKGRIPWKLRWKIFRSILRGMAFRPKIQNV